MEPREVPDPHPVGLFEFLRLVAVAGARGRLTRQQAAVASLVALDSSGTTGENAKVKADLLAVELGITERTVWRHFGVLVDGGWLVQTVRPTRGYKGQPGRKARYRLTDPRLDLSPDNRLTDASGSASHENRPDAESSDSSAPNRLTVSAESSDSPTREVVTVSPSDGAPSDGSPSSGHRSDQTTDRARDADDITIDGRAEACRRELRRVAQGGTR